SRIHKPEKEPFSFPRNIHDLELIITKTKARLLIVDPIMGFISDLKTDANAEAHVRKFMAPLIEVVRRTKVAALLIRHFKKEGAAAIHRGIGSQAWTAVCRLQAVVGDPDGSGTVVLASAKNNLGPRATSLGFQVEQTQVHFKAEADEKGRV